MIMPVSMAFCGCLCAKLASHAATIATHSYHHTWTIVTRADRDVGCTLYRQMMAEINAISSDIRSTHTQCEQILATAISTASGAFAKALPPQLALRRQRFGYMLESIFNPNLCLDAQLHAIVTAAPTFSDLVPLVCDARCSKLKQDILQAALLSKIRGGYQWSQDEALLHDDIKSLTIMASQQLSAFHRKLSCWTAFCTRTSTILNAISRFLPLQLLLSLPLFAAKIFHVKSTAIVCSFLKQQWQTVSLTLMSKKS
eukprot:SAG31_NODE_468_length_15250_cov_5.304138_4_plen_256_part_00